MILPQDLATCEKTSLGPKGMVLDFLQRNRKPEQKRVIWTSVAFYEPQQEHLGLFKSHSVIKLQEFVNDKQKASLHETHDFRICSNSQTSIRAIGILELKFKGKPLISNASRVSTSLFITVLYLVDVMERSLSMLRDVEKAFDTLP